MFKKAKYLLLCVAVILTFALMFTSCALLKPRTEASDIPSDTPVAVAEIYREAQKLGFDGSLDEFLMICKGEDGHDGLGISSTEIDEDGHFIIVYTDGSISDLGKIGVSVESTCDHYYDDCAVVIEPSCVSMGYQVYSCCYCGNMEGDFIEAVGHSFGEGIVIKEAGAEQGVMLYSCEDCGMAKMELFGEVYSEGLSYEMIEDKEEYRVNGLGTCEDEAIVIPETHEGLPVTEIGEKAFYDCDYIVSVKIPTTILKIWDKAFSECENLVDLTVPDTAELGTDVFRGSINVEIAIQHPLVFVDYKEATCYEAGNIAHYRCESCEMFYEDEDGEIRIYDVVIPSAHDFVDGACAMCGKVMDEVLIVSVDPIAHLGKFPLGTLETAIGLPNYINVYTADGVTHSLVVRWDVSDYYDKTSIGNYTIKGYIESGDYYYADGLSNVVTAEVEIAEAMIGTADIVFVLDISGSMGSYINSVKNNIIAFAEAIEAAGVSARWSAVTYSDLTVSGKNEQSMIIKNGAADWFTNASDYKSAINSIVLAGGGDAPETAVDGLMLANTLTTRSDARVFYILLTDCSNKINNNYGVGSMEEAAEILAADGVNVSVITDSYYISGYRPLTDKTGGLALTNINGNFSQSLLDNLVPIIFGEVVS